MQLDEEQFVELESEAGLLQLLGGFRKMDVVQSLVERHQMELLQQFCEVNPDTG